MLFRLASLISVASAAELSEDAISLLQLRASKRDGEDSDLDPAEEAASDSNGFCGLGLLTNVDEDATLGTLVAKFEASCEAAENPDTGLQMYSTVLCEQLRQTLAQGINLDKPATSDSDDGQKLCAELRRLTQAHFDHESDDVDSTVQKKESQPVDASTDTTTPPPPPPPTTAPPPPPTTAPPTTAPPTTPPPTTPAPTTPAPTTPAPEACVADVDCQGHGTTADNDKADGCECECLDGWSGGDCAMAPEEATTTVDVGQAIDDPHLTSLHGTHFDLYTSGKYTLLSVPRHATGDDADLLVTAYVEKIGERKNDLWIRRMTLSGKWLGEHYSFKTSSGHFGSEGTHLVRVGAGDWQSPASAQKEKPAHFKVLSHKKHEAPTHDMSQSIADRVELECGPVTALIRWATVQKNGEDVNHIDFRMSGLHNLGENVGGLLADEFDAE